MRNNKINNGQFLKREDNKPDAAVVLDHLHPRGDGGSLGGVKCGVNSVVQNSIRPVIAEDVQQIKM